VVLITHDMDVARYGTRIVAIRYGQIVSDRPNIQTRAAEVAPPLSVVNG
jgi:ABC-type phosphate/phosphonate transport system ATPase subunit